MAYSRASPTLCRPDQMALDQMTQSLGDARKSCSNFVQPWHNLIKLFRVKLYFLSNRLESCSTLALLNELNTY
jgi:hypothetical protein